MLYNSLLCPMVPRSVQDFSNVFLCVAALPLSGTLNGIFWGLNFGPGIFFEALLEALGIFLGLDFWLHLIILVS